MKRPGVPKQMPIVSAGDVKGGGFPLRPGIQYHRYQESYTMTDTLKAPFPWPGGKSDMAPAVWARFGTVENYCEPFCGSAAVALGRPGGAHATETANDIDGLLINAYRGIQFYPDETAEWCDWPVSEVDLTARHLWLKAHRDEITERLFADPFYCDVIAAGWWLWGIASWIGDGWCVADGPWINVDGRLVDRRLIGSDENGVPSQMPRVAASNATRDKHIGGQATEVGIHKYRASVPRKMPEIGRSPNGQMQFNRKGVQAYRHHAGVPRKMPEVGGNAKGASIYHGVNRTEYAEPTALASYFARLSDRLRRVRFLCGDWSRCVKPSVTVNHGLTAVFLDPPYPQAEHDMAYHEAEITITPLDGQDIPDPETLAAMTEKAMAAYLAEQAARAEQQKNVEPWYQAAAWAVEHGDDPRLRICIAGYWSDATDALFPASWERVRWEARGGYANQKADGRGRKNAKRECLWFSPSCLDPTDEARDTLSRPIVVRDSDYTGTMFQEDDV